MAKDPPSPTLNHAQSPTITKQNNLPIRLTFLYLKAFIVTGGIEKVNRVILKALWDMQQQNDLQATAASPYSIGSDARYFPDNQLLPFRGQRWRFMLHMLIRPPETDVLLVGHINLAPAALLFRLRYPKLRMIVITHGIEVWHPLGGLKKWMLKSADQIIAVSQYTKNKLVELQGLDADKISVLPNCLDPYFELPTLFSKPDYLLRRYGLRKEQKVLLTISRLNVQEGYKGYDHVLECLPSLLKRYPDLVYILAGKSDETEKQRLEAIITRLGIAGHVQIPGFIPDEELSDHYRLADVFVMPSKKEGFGIVFIEAMACGTPAIGGNSDGSPEALRPGELGDVVNPDDFKAISATILDVLGRSIDRFELQQKTVYQYNYPQYREQLNRIINFNYIDSPKD